MKRLLFVSLVILAVFALGVVVSADTGTAPGQIKKNGDIAIGVGSELGTAQFVPAAEDWTSDSYEFEGKTYYTFSYSLPAPIVYYAAGHDGDPAYEIGAIEQMWIDIDQDPALSVNFVCRGGAATTTFSFSNYLDVLLYNAQAQATASVTATDRNGNGATLVGLFPGAKVYEARYNADVNFAYLVDGGVAPVNLSYSDNEDTGIGYTPLNTTLTRMEAEYQFTISARDGASGTSNYVTVGTIPEPSSLLVLAAGMIPVLGAIRRRR
jgi:hypothetical protein